MKKWVLLLRKSYESRTNLKRASINTSWLMVEQLTRLFVGFFVSVLITRYLGPKGLGLLNYANSWVYMFSALAYLGLDSIVIKRLVEKKDATGSVLGSAFVLKLGGGFLALFLSIFSLLLFGQNDIQTIVLVAIISLGYIFLPTSVVDFYYRSKLKVKYTVLVRVAVYLLVTIIKIVCILLEANIYYFGILISLELLFNCLGYVFLFYRKDRIKLSYSWIEVVNIFFSALPILLSSLMVGVYSKIDHVFVGSMINNETLGYYSLSASLIQQFYFIPLIVVSSVFPVLVEERSKQNILSYKNKVWKTVKYLLLAAVFLVLCANIFSKYLIDLLYGDRFYLTSSLLNIYSFNLIPVFLSGIFSYWLIIENRQKITLYLQFVTMTISILLNFVLIGDMGVYGAVYSSVVTNVVITILLFGACLKTYVPNNAKI